MVVVLQEEPKQVFLVLKRQFNYISESPLKTQKPVIVLL